MADIGVFPASLADALAAPTVALLELAVFVFGDGAGGTVTRRYHRGAGTLTIEGEDYIGISDPGGLRVVDISYVELPTTQVASKVDITLAGVDQAFQSLLISQINDIRGASAEIYFVCYDTDTYQPIGPPVLVFDNGVCGHPRFSARSDGLRTFTLPIDGIWSAKNHEPGGRLNDADQTQRFPGDRGFELIGSAAFERIK